MKRLLAPLFLLIATLHFAMAQNVTSCLEIYDLQSRTHQVICEFPFLIEAPNWSPDGKWLLVNKEGQLYRIAPDGKNVVYISYMDTEVEPGDHPANKHVQLRMIPSEGGTPEVLLDFFGGQGSLNVNSWNPGSTRFAFVSYRL